MFFAPLQIRGSMSDTNNRTTEQTLRRTLAFGLSTTTFGGSPYSHILSSAWGWFMLILLCPLFSYVSLVQIWAGSWNSQLKYLVYFKMLNFYKLLIFRWHKPTKGQEAATKTWSSGRISTSPSESESSASDVKKNDPEMVVFPRYCLLMDMYVTKWSWQVTSTTNLVKNWINANSNPCQ